MAEEPIKKWLEDMFHKSIVPNPVPLDQVTKQIEQFNKQAQDSWEQFLKLLQSSFIDLNEKVIETNIQGGPSYKTVIFINGNRKNDFPNPAPNASDVYWLRHNTMVDETLSLQKEIITKVIDTLGTTLQKVVNPISFSTKNLVDLADLFKKH